MIRLIAALIFLVLALIAGAVMVFSAWDPAPPSARIERVVPDDHFRR